MFEATLKDKLKRIFDLPQATYMAHIDLKDIHNDVKEQNKLFIAIDSARNTIKDGLHVANVKGKVTVFCRQDQLPYGYFAKKIQEADIADTKDLFFFNIEHNTNSYLEIAERSFEFVYLFAGQYNPNIGTLESITTEIE